MIIHLSKIKKILIAGSLLLICVCCKKDTYQNFPYVYVEEVLPATTLSSLTIGSAISVPGGVKGILIYQSGSYEYLAFDRLCTNYPNDTCAVVINSGVFAVCPCCKSKFLLSDGSVLRGPAKYGLKQYSAAFDGSRLNIRN